MVEANLLSLLHLEALDVSCCVVACLLASLGLCASRRCREELYPPPLHG